MVENTPLSPERRDFNYPWRYQTYNLLLSSQDCGKVLTSLLDQEETPMQHFADHLPGWFGPQDMRFYQMIVDQAPSSAHFVEVGSWKGRSSAYMTVAIVNSGKSIRFDCVDTWLGSEEHQLGQSFEDASVVQGTLFAEFLHNMKPVQKYYRAVRKPSTEAAELYRDQSLDFVFLDAAHDYENVKSDIKSWLPKTKQGGILAGHDSFHPPIIDACEELLPGYQTVDTCWMYRVC